MDGIEPSLSIRKAAVQWHQIFERKGLRNFGGIEPSLFPHYAKSQDRRGLERLVRGL